MLAILGLTLLQAVVLPEGSAPNPVDIPGFPDRMHAYVWVNWGLVPAERMEQVVEAPAGALAAMAARMGLPAPGPVSEDQQRRSYITVIRRNWHLLPYEQLLALLEWTPEELAYTLREDDFLFIKLGSLKPKCELLVYAEPDAATLAREKTISEVLAREFPDGLGAPTDPLFGFVKHLSEMPEAPAAPAQENRFSPRYCSSYFMLYGDPYLNTDAPPYPEGYLARLAAAGADSVWLQAVLYKLAPFPWDPSLSERCEERLKNLRAMTEQGRRQGMGLYLYLNEPRAMPLAFFEEHPGLRGVTEGDHATLCVSVPEVRQYIRDSVASICRAAPELAGFFTITASENLTNCWSHGQGMSCPRCAPRGPEGVLSDVNAAIIDGIHDAGSKAELIAWDWGWPDDRAEAIIQALPQDVSFMSVSEWSLPLVRGGISTVVGEYSISAIGPGPRATKHWGIAQARGLKTIAKVQANNTWELSSVPWVPAVDNVARHAANLREAGVKGFMLGWTLGGHPSPNLDVFAEIGRDANVTPEEAQARVAARRYGPALAPHVVKAWREVSVAYQEYPYNGSTMYMAPQQMGPANPLWEKPTGFKATMVGMPYDDLPSWIGNFPVDVFIGQFEKMADGFESALRELKAVDVADNTESQYLAAFAEEMRMMDACAVHLRSVANQTRFVRDRDALASASGAAARELANRIEKSLQSELDLAKRMYALQMTDSRFGYEGSNHYFYVPADLAAKVINCADLLERWLPAERKRLGIE